MVPAALLAPLAIAGTVASAGAAVYGGFAASSAAQYQAGVAETNARIAEQNADYTRKQGLEAVQVQGLKNKAQQGAILAAQGASGLDIGGGTATEVRSGASELGRLSEDTEWDKAQMKAYGYDVTAGSDRAEAAAKKSEAGNDVIGGFLKAGASIAGGATSFSDKWGSWSGAFGKGSKFADAFGGA